MSVPAAYISIILIWSTTPLTIAAIVYLGIIGSVLGFALYYYVLKHVDTTRVALITVITPVIALLLGHLLNGEAIQVEALIGTAAILSGLLLFEYWQKAGKWVRDTLIGQTARCRPSGNPGERGG